LEPDRGVQGGGGLTVESLEHLREGAGGSVSNKATNLRASLPRTTALAAAPEPAASCLSVRQAKIVCEMFKMSAPTTILSLRTHKTRLSTQESQQFTH
jgi:hypothetical protein